MCFMCPPRNPREDAGPALFNLTGIPLKRAVFRPPAPAASAPAAGATGGAAAARPASAKYSAFKALKAQRKLAAEGGLAPESEPEPEVDDGLVSETEALAIAHAAAGSAGGKSEGRRVGCCILDSTSGSGQVLAAASNAWDLPLSPNTGICAERRALATLMLHGTLGTLCKSSASSERWTMVVTHSPCVHCAATILLFPEISRVVYGQAAAHRDAGVEILREGGLATALLPDPIAPPPDAAEHAAKRPRPLPPITPLQVCELRNRGGSLLFRGVPSGGCETMDARVVIIAAARAAAAHSGFVEQPGLAEDCTLRVDRVLNYLEKLFCATCGVKVEVADDVCAGGGDTTSSVAQTEQPRAARLGKLKHDHT